MNISYVNEEWVENAVAYVSVNERAFRFGDGVFETVAVHEGIPYLWKYHKERLLAGLVALAIPEPACDLRAVMMELIEINKTEEGLVRIAVSRGTGGRGYLPAQEATDPTVIVELFECPAPPASPVTLWLSRWEKISPRALPTGCKLSQGINPTLARMEAVQNGCQDALQLDANGHIAEASSSNIFWLAGGTLHTPSLATGALAGVTRRRIMEISPYPVQEGLYTPKQLAAAEAVILTNAAQGIVAAGALLPGTAKWESVGLAAEFSGLRRRDITSLAQA